MHEEYFISSNEDSTSDTSYEKSILIKIEDQIANTYGEFTGEIESENDFIMEYIKTIFEDIDYDIIANFENVCRISNYEKEYDIITNGLVEIFKERMGICVDLNREVVDFEDLYDIYTTFVLSLKDTLTQSTKNHYMSRGMEFHELTLENCSDYCLSDEFSAEDNFIKNASITNNAAIINIKEKIDDFVITIDNDVFIDYIHKYITEVVFWWRVKGKMDEKLKNYFELTKNNSVLVKDNKYVEIRIPDILFKNKISNITGDKITTFAFLDILVWDNVNDRSIKNATKIRFRLPNIIVTQPHRIYHDNKEEEHVLEYYGGDLFIISTKVPMSPSVVVSYFNLILSGKVPSDISYGDISKYLEECAILNNFNMKVNSLFIDLIVSVVCRDPNNLSRQFREAIKDNPKISMHSREMVNMEIIPALTSQFGAITSGNPKYGITTTIGAIRSGDMKPENSDIEKAIE